MNAATALLGYAAGVGFLAPRLLLRSAWPHRAPVLAVAVWHGLTVSFTLAVALAAHHLAAPAEHLHANLIGVLHSCGLTTATAAPYPTIADRLAIALPFSVVLLMLGCFVYEVLLGRRARSRHRQVLDMVGRRSRHLCATILEHDLPAAYSLPGYKPRVVVSAGALRLLSPGQLEAVLEHERAHIAGRHHLALAAAQAFARVFRRLPLAHHAKEQTSMLLEMIADDRALRRQSREVLAAAMYEMAAAKAAPAGAFAMGGPSAGVRLRRVLTPQRRPHFALRGSVAAAAAVVPVIPLLFGCIPAIG
ncbi:M56 family metallopeptidase [Streptomyces sp. S.PNR 29]|uniref:M56 family metallopeptidase n=1 Tax=Streptomyces sp. S.PNR 29 TaxID=2973805 RepID=UPI0025AF9B3F|nr:M56 family metallopeptidase [Streptomyces sp. S.PNR 29]MDN0199964.1 M56 family metallopeptidase [Streptomyces sp. S.PNR 29]